MLVANLTALLVDDSRELRRSLAQAFAAAGWRVLEAGDLTVARMYLDAGGVDVVVADRRRGAGAGAALVARGLPVVLLTGDTSPVPGATVIAKGNVQWADVVEAARAAVVARWAGDREPMTEGIPG